MSKINAGKYTADAAKSRDTIGARRVRYDAQVKDESGRVVFSVGFYRGPKAKERALAEARARIQRKIQTGDFNGNMAEDLTPEGIQLVIPGAERQQAPGRAQMELF